jgi:hypothetical protein
MSASFKSSGTLNARLAELATNLKAAQKVHVGFLESATYENKPVAYIAAIQEFGDPGSGSPPRPFFRTMIANEKNHWGQDIAKKLLATNYNAKQSLDQMGQEIKAELQTSIIDLVAPPLSRTTIMLRAMRAADPTLGDNGNPISYATVNEARARVAAGESTNGVSEKPLIDSGHMLNSVDYEVDPE